MYVCTCTFIPVHIMYPLSTVPVEIETTGVRVETTRVETRNTCTYMYYGIPVCTMYLD